MSVIPIEREINNTKRQIDDMEWEDKYCEHLKQHLDYLVKEYLNGETWYPNF